MQLAASHADIALRRARACGLWRQVRMMSQFLDQLDRRKASDALKTKKMTVFPNRIIAAPRLGRR
jgi:hypothetical protein